MKPKNRNSISCWHSGAAGKCTDYDNTATITETEQSASQKVTLCVGKDLTVSKTASGTFNRTYLWKITKDVNETEVKIADGGSYTFKYTVVAEQTGFTDAGWTLSGKITIDNPNDWPLRTVSPSFPLPAPPHGRAGR